jgi:hypothetical protein
MVENKRTMIRDLSNPQSHVFDVIEKSTFVPSTSLGNQHNTRSPNVLHENGFSGDALIFSLYEDSYESNHYPYKVSPPIQNNDGFEPDMISSNHISSSLDSI